MEFNKIVLLASGRTYFGYRLVWRYVGVASMYLIVYWYIPSEYYNCVRHNGLTLCYCISCTEVNRITETMTTV